MSKIEKYIDDTILKYTNELKRQGLIRNNRQSPFQKTETLLYNYNHFKSAVEDKKQQMKEIEKVGIAGKSKDITIYSGQGGSNESKSNHEKAEEKLDSIQTSIYVTQNFIRLIDSAIDMIRDDPYFDIIRMKYFEGKSREAIAEHFDVDASTISRNKNRLVNTLQIRLFSDEVIFQIFS
ncbi:hypothetical protein ACFO0S_09705 [Chryseomicrobium palamuruense]|uniref:Sigma-70 family RNA polymerase sigma factor n=1 Tax=Chryseomicrobium palamuruense TaxID=682973 RepID=A0ABV8UXL8_9BACL